MSVDSRDNASAVSGSVTNYLCLAPEDKARDALGVFNEIGIYLFPDVPASDAEAHSLAKQGTLALTLAYMPDPSRAGEPLSPSLDIRSVLFPPLVVLVDREPSSAEREELRIQGAAYILRGPPDLGRDATTIRALARSSSWMSAKIERMPLPDVLQTMAVHNQSGMVSIACKHMRCHSNFSWKQGQKLCRARSGLNRECPGWYGRLYVSDGMLIHAETPTAEGVPALAQLLRASFGSVRIHEVFIPPEQPNITGSMHSNLLNAAWVADEDARNAPPSIPAPSARISSRRNSMPPAAGAPTSRAGVSPGPFLPETPVPPTAQPLSLDLDSFLPKAAGAPVADASDTPEPPATGPVAPFEPGQILSLTEFELTFPSAAVAPAPEEKKPSAPAQTPLQQPAAPKASPPRPATRPITFTRRPVPEVTVVDAPPLGSDSDKTPSAQPLGSDSNKTPVAPPVMSPSAPADESPLTGAAPTAGFDALLGSAPDLRAAARADEEGNVYEMAGDADAETFCAVGALALRALNNVEKLADLGSLRSFTVASPKGTLYVLRRPSGFVAALGDATKNTEATMRIVTELAGTGISSRR
ncbi:MAG: hypothetical protein HUU21_08795 [Polyangiaceae bacterium]|nr:hypothetical protein [Polyangiaceae bacterium]